MNSSLPPPHAMESLPDDVLIDILSRFRVRHLCQLKCVSKQWLKLISSPLFKIIHSTTRSPRLLVVRESTEGHPSIFGQPLSRTLSISTIDISTGEICNEFTKDIVGRQYSLILSNNLICFEKFMAIAICNPTTHEIVHLPLPSQPTVRYSMGYNQAKNEYKIIHSFRNSKRYHLEFEIITLKDAGPVPKSWRKLEVHSSPLVRWYFDSPLIDFVDVDGSMYWLINSRQGNIGSQTIIRFDTETERFGTISYPSDHLLEENGYEQLVNIQGSLYLAYYSQQSSTVSMFLLKDHATHLWAKEYIIELHEIYKNVGDDAYLRIMGYLPGEDNNGELLIKTNGMKTFLCNMKKRSFRSIGQTEKWNGWCKNLYCDRFFTFGK